MIALSIAHYWQLRQFYVTADDEKIANNALAERNFKIIKIEKPNITNNSMTNKLL